MARAPLGFIRLVARIGPVDLWNRGAGQQAWQQAQFGDAGVLSNDMGAACRQRDQGGLHLLGIVNLGGAW
jgi:hypothetical protein